MKLNAIEVIRKAVESHRAGDLQEAERLYSQVILNYPEVSESKQLNDAIAVVYNNLGFVLQQKGNLDAAIENYKKAIALKPNNHEALNNLGFTQALQGNLQGAISSYREAVRLKPDFIEAYYHMGHALQEKGELNASAECYRKMIKIRPDSADAFNALGAVLQLKGDLDASIDSFKQALSIDPGYHEAYNNLGCSFQAMQNHHSALECFRNALSVKPDYVSALNNMGHSLHDIGEWEAALDCYRHAINVRPDSVEAYSNIANALRKEGKIEEALKYFEALQEPRFRKAFEVGASKPLFWINAKSQILECLYTLGRYTELEAELNKLGEAGDINRRVAAVGAFVTHQLKINNPLPFCKQPLDFISVGNLGDHVRDVDAFTSGLIQQGDRESQVWEPRHGVTRSGFVTSNTIFHAGGHCETLAAILRREIAAYYDRFRSQDCDFIRLWPEEYELKGWFVRLVKNGSQRSHIHPAGWLSGVVYLKTLDSAGSDYGAIEHSLHGFELPVLDDSYPRRVHRPKPGDILLFPSSAFHRTIPFSEDTDRCVIAFDMLRVPGQ